METLVDALVACLAAWRPRLTLDDVNRTALRRVINWLNLSTPAGVVVAVIGGGRLARGPHDLLLAERYRARFPAPNAPAVTIGDVVLLRMDRDQATSHPTLLQHELQHAIQYAWWLGPFGFIPAYLCASVWSWWHTGNFALRNGFEVHAGLVEGGYLRPPDPGQDSGSAPQHPNAH